MKKLRPSHVIVIRQLASGKTREEIAATLGIALSTLDSRVMTMKKHLKAKTSCQMVGNYLKLKLCELFNDELVSKL